MQVTVENVSALRKCLSITLPKDYVGARIDAAYRKLRNDVAIKGFRKGKVPQKVLEKNFGERVKAEVVEEIIQETYFDALKESQLDAVAHPDIKSYDLRDDGSFVYEAEVDIRPVFEVNGYKGVEIEHPEVVVSDEEIEKSLELTRREMAPLRTVDDRPAKADDLVIIDFQGFENGEPVQHVKASEYSVDLGSGRNGKEFEEMLLGLRKGEQATREASFPAEFSNPLLAGKTIRFEITVKDVKERQLAALDDEFAKDVSEEFATLEDLKKSIADKIRKQKERTMDGDITDKIMLKLMESHPFELPGRLVAFEINELIKELENNLQRRGLTLESAGLNREKLAEQYKETAEKRVRGDFILKKIAEVEAIKLVDEDINIGFNRIAQQYGMPVDEVRKYFQNRNDMLPFMSELLSEKILNFLRKEAKVTVVPAHQAAAGA